VSNPFSGKIFEVKSDEWEGKVSANAKLPEPEPVSQGKKEKFFVQAKINDPILEKSQYETLLCKHYDLFSKDITDLGKTNNFEHKIDLKENSLICVKQFPMPEVHRDILEGQIKDWLKMGFIQTRSNQQSLVHGAKER
jgi:hypothetical protein